MRDLLYFIFCVHHFHFEARLSLWTAIRVCNHANQLEHRLQW